MKSVCDGNKDGLGGIHCVCYKCNLDCENNRSVETHQHRWRCERIGRDWIMEMFQRATEEMRQHKKIRGGQKSR
jgi:hypothetical protein